MSKVRSLRQLKLPLGVTRLKAVDVRDLLKRAERQPRRSKYGAIRTETIDGHSFDSKREARHYLALKLREQAGEICDLELQPRFPLIVNGMKICEYRADFQWKTPAGEIVIADAKGFRTAAYRIKKKLFESLYGLPILEM